MVALPSVLHQLRSEQRQLPPRLQPRPRRRLQRPLQRRRQRPQRLPRVPRSPKVSGRPLLASTTLRAKVWWTPTDTQMPLVQPVAVARRQEQRQKVKVLEVRKAGRKPPHQGLTQKRSARYAPEKHACATSHGLTLLTSCKLTACCHTQVVKEKGVEGEALTMGLTASISDDEDGTQPPPSQKTSRKPKSSSKSSSSKSSSSKSGKGAACSEEASVTKAPAKAAFDIADLLID